MRKKLSLYIGGLPALLDDDGLILFNYTREQLESPAIVKNSYTQTISLPRCPKNDRIFGHFGRFDRATNLETINRTGEGYNALKRLDFDIYSDTSDKLVTGYCKLEEVNSDSYKIALYGGLGDLLYALRFDAAGNKRTLGTLKYRGTNGTWIDPATSSYTVTANRVMGAWDYLGGSASADTTVNFLNFIPCYNGLPSGDFDSNKAVFVNGDFANLNSSAGTGSPLPDAHGQMLATFGNKRTEWEVQDLRSYQQRMIISVRSIIDAIVHEAQGIGYGVILGDFFSDSNPRYTELWMTLPIATREVATSSSSKIADFLVGTMSPADFLTSYVKTYGLVLRMDQSSKELHIESRDEFYDTELPQIDLSQRVERNSVVLKPYSINSRTYVWRNQMLGESAKKYAENTGKTLESVTVDTGYDFDSAQNDVMSSLAFKGAPSVLESSPWFAYWGSMDDPYEPTPWNEEWCKFGSTEDITITLYNAGAAVQVQAKPFDANVKHTYSRSASYTDAFEKIQLHDEDNKSIDGSGALVHFAGMYMFVPDDEDLSVLKLHVSDDTEEMLLLNNNKPCWDIRQSLTQLESIPTFDRSYCAFTSQFNQRWKNYMYDRLDVDSKVMTARVDLGGLVVNQDLMRRLFWYGGTVWALNRIVNYSLTTSDLTLCEFVKVKNIANYVNGQTE